MSFLPRCLIAAAVCAFALPAFTQPIITSFTTNGVLACSQLAPGTVATVEWSFSLTNPASWQDLQSGTVAQDGTIQLTVPASQATAPRFYRVRGTGWPANMALIPAGSFTMGDALDGTSSALPLHSVHVSAFYMDKHEVTKALWDEVYQWATNHGYGFDYSDSGQGKTNNHPAHTMTWYDAVKWWMRGVRKRTRLLLITPMRAYRTATGPGKSPLL